MRIIGTIKHNDNQRDDRVEIAYDEDHRILVAKAADEDWCDAHCGTIADIDEAIAHAMTAWDGEEWDLQLFELAD